jgi:hypothetical protein
VGQAPAALVLELELEGFAGGIQEQDIEIGLSPVDGHDFRGRQLIEIP